MGDTLLRDKSPKLRHKNWGVCQCEVGRSANDHWQYIGKNGEINFCPG